MDGQIGAIAIFKVKIQLGALFLVRSVPHVDPDTLFVRLFKFHQNVGSISTNDIIYFENKRIFSTKTSRFFVGL